MARDLARLGRIVAVEGPSSVGKTTLVRQFARDPEFLTIPEAHARLRPRPSLRPSSPAGLLRLERRLLAEEGRRYREAHAGAREGRSVILDTGFFGPITYSEGLARIPPRWDIRGALSTTLLRDWTRGRRRLPDVTIYLDAPTRRLRARALRDPRGHPRELLLRHLAVARLERKWWRAAAERLDPGRIVFLRGDRSPAQLARRLRVLLAQAPPGSPGAGETRRLLAFVRSRAGNR
ncbi:MAG TPA: AAA family ATPase [Thermoplasmata archaeon]|nr:AAA family ATPase [Thermoplasmata archaeon]